MKHNKSIYESTCKAYYNTYTPTGACKEVILFVGSYNECVRVAEDYAKRNKQFCYTSQYRSDFP